MSAADPNVRELSVQDRQKLDELLLEFHRTWEAGRLERALADLPLDPPYRLAAVTGFAAIDLEQHWQHGQPVSVEEYLQKYPELGTVDNVSIELLLAEFFSRERYETAPDLNAFLNRFPQQADDLRRLIALAKSPRLSNQRAKPSGNTSIHSQPSEDGPVLPEQFDRYRILKKLGQGGMGTVYLAHDTKLERKVALKVPRFAPGSNAENLERFYREARATATIMHPNLCPLYDVGEINGTPYLTMAYIEGWPLSKFIRTDKLLPQFGVATVVRIVAQAIEEAHKRGVIHRDLKPGNIMINKRGEPIVMDFGLARWLNADKDDIRLTRSGAILGAPVYMSPEQVYGDVDAMGPGCDVYSLGVILYELLTGRLPFEGPTTAVLAKTLIQAPKPPSAWRPDVDPRLEAICLKAMAKKISERYASMAELAAMLTEYIRAERQAQTLTSLSMTALPSNGSSASALSGTLPPGGSSKSGLGKSQATRNTVAVESHATQTQIDDEVAAVLDPESIPLPSASGVQLAKPKRNLLLLWAGLAGVGALAALLFLGLMLWLLWPNPQRQPTTTATPEMGMILLALSDTPEDVEVRLDGNPLKREDLKKPLTLTPGQHQVEVKAAKFEPWSQPILVKSGDNAPLEVTLRPKEVVAVPAEMSTIQLSLGGIPEDAEVRLDGNPLKREDLKKPLTLKAGKHQVEIKAAKFEPWSQTISVKGGENAPLEVTLRPKEPVVVKAPQPGVPFEGHTGAIKALAWSGDSRFILSGSEDFTLRLWDAGTREAKQVFNGHTLPVTSVALSKDGTRALSGGGDGLVILWDVQTGKIVHRLTGHTDWVRTVAISADGKWGLSGGDDHSVRLWDLDRGEMVKKFDGHLDKIWTVAFSRDGKRAASGGEDRTVRIWNLETPGEPKQLLGHAAAVRSVAFLPDGRLLSGSDDRTLRLWDTTTGTMVKSFVGHVGKVRGVAVSSDGKLAASVSFGNDDNTVRLWDIDKGTLRYGLGSAPQGNNAVAFAPNDSWVISGGDDRVIRLWDVTKPSTESVPLLPVEERILEARRFSAPKHDVERVAISKDGRFALSAGYDGTVCYWDLNQGRLLRSIPVMPTGTKGVVHFVVFSPDERMVLACGDDNLATLWNLETGALVKKFEGHTDKVWCAIFTPDGKHIITSAGDKDKTARLWDVDSGAMLKEYKGHTKAINSIAISSDGKHLVTAGWDSTLRVWDVDTATELHTFKGTGGNFSTVAFLPDGRRAVAASGSTIKVYDTIDFKELRTLEDKNGHTNSVWIVAASPGGHRIVSGGQENFICLWDADSGKLLHKYTGHTNSVPALAFLPDGTRFLSGSKDATLRVWDLPRRDLYDPPPLPATQETKKETQLLQPPSPTPQPVDQVSFTADGKRVVWCGSDKVLHDWNLADGKEVATFKDHPDGVRSFALLPDGKRVLSASYEGQLRLWELDTGKDISTFSGPDKHTQCVVVTSDGKRAVSVGDDKFLHVWDIDTAKELQKLPGHQATVLALALTPDDHEAITGGLDKTIRRWNLDTGVEVARWTTLGDVHTVAVSPDGQRVLSGGKEKVVQLWDRSSGELLASFVGHTGTVTCVRFSPDGRWALSSSEDKTVRLWNIETGQETARYTGNTLSAKSVAFAPDGRTALSGGADGSVRLWTLPPYTAPVPVESLHTYQSPGQLDRVAISPDGRLALSAGYDKTVRLWDVERGTELKVYDWHTDGVRFVSFSPDGRRAASCGNDKTAVVWDVDTGTVVRHFDSFKSIVWTAVFSPDGKLLLTCCEDGTAAVWDVESGKSVKTFMGHTSRINAAAWTPDGTRVVTAGIDKTARLWDVATGKELKRYEGHNDGVATVAVAPNARYVVTGSYDKSVRLWELETGKCLFIFEGHTGQVWNVAFSPDGRRILSGGQDKTMKLWDVERRQLLKSYEQHEGGVAGVAFHPDGRRALSASQDKTMRLWGLPVY